jgi:hypothetical protein
MKTAARNGVSSIIKVRTVRISWACFRLGSLTPVNKDGCRQNILQINVGIENWEKSVSFIFKLHETS